MKPAALPICLRSPKITERFGWTTIAALNLASALAATADLAKQTITREEEVFVNLVILHTDSAFYAMKDELVIKLEGLRRDVRWFFSLPIPIVVWERVKVFQNDEFVAFVEQCRN